LSDFFLFAEIKSVIDNNGYVLAKSFSDVTKSIGLFSVFIDLFGDKRKLIVESFEQNNVNLILKFKNFDSEEDVRILCGKKLFILRPKAEKLNQNEYLIKDLLGCKVKFEDKFFGKLIDVIQLESNDVYVLLNQTEDEILLPAIKDFIRLIDVSKKEIILTKSIEDIFE